MISTPRVISPSSLISPYLGISSTMHISYRSLSSEKEKDNDHKSMHSPVSPPTQSTPTPTLTPVSWIDSDMIPPSMRPYLHLARADKQVGTMLLLWPCVWSVCLAAPLGSLPSLPIISQFAIGALVMRSAGCTINDIWDRDFDKHVERTKTRPLASGALTVPQALQFLGLQLTCGLGVLVSLHPNCILLGLGSMPLVVAYPLMKRFMNWPQFVLGLAFNWGALMGWTAVHGETSLPHVLPLYTAGVCWTLVYDTLYGYQDRKDDKKLGLKSTALTFGDNPQAILSLLATGVVAGLSISGMEAHLTSPFYVGVGGVGAHLLWQIWTANLNDPKNLWARFCSNRYTGALIAASIVAGHF